MILSVLNEKSIDESYLSSFFSACYFGMFKEEKKMMIKAAMDQQK